ncbi:MAG: hypothetical protein BM556_07435 [Bacteriovorax sp. MedPE-SWde]|nr:MAG: hypothetical protein BM556_07435 [Bacteriovorax sp. MedPE-SWde]
MKKLLCLLALVLLTQSAWSAVVEGMINWGPYINCEVYNSSHRPELVRSYQYTITYTTGMTETRNVPCQFNCRINPYSFQRFTGPRNSPYVMSASCRAFTVPPRHRRPYPRY